MLYTLLAAFAVGWLFDRLRVPGGMMVGSVVGACALNLLTGQADMPPAAKTAAQIAAGAFIGVGVRREDLKQKAVALSFIKALRCSASRSVLPRSESSFLLH